MTNLNSMPLHQDRELPYFTLRQIDLPDLTDWDINGEYYLVIKVKMTGKNNREDLSGNDKTKLEGSFKMLGVKKLEDKQTYALEQKAFKDKIAKVRGGEYA